MVKVINILVFGTLLYGLSFTFGTTNVASKDASCDLKTQCLVSDRWPCNCNHKRTDSSQGGIKGRVQKVCKYVSIVWTSEQVSDMWLATLETGAAHLRYGFLAGAKAIWYCMNIPLTFWSLPVLSRCHQRKNNTSFVFKNDAISCLSGESLANKSQGKFSSVFNILLPYVEDTLTTSNSWHYSCPSSLYCRSIE